MSGAISQEQAIHRQWHRPWQLLSQGAEKSILGESGCQLESRGWVVAQSRVVFSQ